MSPAARRQGVVKALFEQNLLPRVLAGSSVGSIGAALALIQAASGFLFLVFVLVIGGSSPLVAAA
jgi:predicted acylesterase/phospholipase RssA